MSAPHLALNVDLSSLKRVNGRQQHRPKRARLLDSTKKFALGFSVVVLVFAAIWPFIPRRYEATASIILRPVDDDGQFRRGQSFRQPLDENAIQSEMDIIGSPSIASAVIAKHDLVHDPEFRSWSPRWEKNISNWVTSVFPSLSDAFPAPQPVTEVELRQRLKGHLNISRDRRSYTIRFGYWSSDPAKAAAMTSTLLSAYLDDQAHRKNRANEKFSNVLSERAEILRGEYKKSQDAVRQFISRFGIVDQSTIEALERQLAIQNTEVTEAKDRAAAAAAKIQMLADLEKRGVLASLPDALTVTSNQDLKSIIATGLSDPSAWLRKGQGRVDPAMLRQAAQNEIQNWQVREALLRSNIGVIRNELVERRRLHSQYEELVASEANNRDLLRVAEVRLKEQKSRVDDGTPDIEILATPEISSKPSSPNRNLALLGTLLAACLAGLAMVWRPALAGAHRSMGS